MWIGISTIQGDGLMLKAARVWGGVSNVMATGGPFWARAKRGLGNKGEFEETVASPLAHYAIPNT
jgi:hypothetical protein